MFSPADENASSKPLIIILDELDRCKPVFALDLLERVKHFFSVPGVHFILGTQMSQLMNSVRVAYGAEVDAGLYLQKFIHLVFHLIDQERHAHERVAVKYVNYLKRVLDFKPEDNEPVELTGDIVANIAHANGFSLRSIERIMSMLAIALAFTANNYLRPPPLVAGLAILKVMRPDVYAKAKRGSLSYDEARSALSFEMAFGEEKRRAEWVAEWWQFATGAKMDDTLVRELYGTIARFHISDRAALLPLVANGVMDRMTPVKAQ